MHKIIQTAIGVTVAAMMLLVVMVPVLDGMTQETMHGDDQNEGESYYYCPMVVWNATEFPRNTGYIQVNSTTGVPNVEWLIDPYTILRPQYTPLEAGIIMYFGENGVIYSDVDGVYTDGEYRPTWGNYVSLTLYDTGQKYGIRNDRMIYEDGEFKVENTSNNWISIGSWCYSLCPKELATMVGGTKMILTDDAESICFQHAATKSSTLQNGQIDGDTTLLKYDPGDLSPGTYNAMDLDGSELYTRIVTLNSVRYSDEIHDGDASVTVSTISHGKIIKLNGFSGDYYRHASANNLLFVGTLFGGTHMVIVPYEQTWTSEHRDLIMLAPVLMAVALLAGMVVTLYNGTRS